MADLVYRNPLDRWHWIVTALQPPPHDDAPPMAARIEPVLYTRVTFAHDDAQDAIVIELTKASRRA